MLKFLQEYQAPFPRTQVFCRKLKELELVEPMHAQLVGTDELERVYLHPQSMHNFNLMRERLAAAGTAGAVA